MHKADIPELKKKIDASSKNVSDQASLERFRTEYLGKNGVLTGFLKGLKNAGPEERAFLGGELNNIKSSLEAFIELKTGELKKEELNKKLSSGSADPTLPGINFPVGGIHPLTAVLHEIIEIFSKLGFVCADGPEIETDYYNFEALNFPEEHPARDTHDTFYLDMADGKKDLILRTHTSPVQIRVMKAHNPPLRILIPGRVFRHEATDATHSFVFNQVEGLVVDEKTNFEDLKGNLTVFARKMFGENLNTRFRPSFFPFTEPSAEMDIECIFCAGKGCRICKFTTWLEIMGAGMVHPSVLKAGGYDSEKYTGYAFGMGVERIAILKYGVNDMRLFFENDIKFLRQF